MSGAPGPGQKFLGGLLLAAGILIASLSGLCSLAFVSSILLDRVHALAGFESLLGTTLLVGIFGGLPFLIGVALIVAGRGLTRAARPPRPPPGELPPPEL